MFLRTDLVRSIMSKSPRDPLKLPRAQWPLPDCVRSLDYTAQVTDMSKDTLRRLIARGLGPRLTRLSPRKIGVRDSDREKWLSERSA